MGKLIQAFLYIYFLIIYLFIIFVLQMNWSQLRLQIMLQIQMQLPTKLIIVFKLGKEQLTGWSNKSKAGCHRTYAFSQCSNIPSRPNFICKEKNFRREYHVSVHIVHWWLHDSRNNIMHWNRSSKQTKKKTLDRHSEKKSTPFLKYFLLEVSLPKGSQSMI